MSYRKNSTKRSFKNAIKWIALVLVTATLSAVAVFAFGGLKATNPFDKELNPDNLLKYENYDKNQLLTDTGYGVEFKWNENGSIRVNGKNGDPTVKENEVKEYVFTSLTLEPGVYTLSGYEKGKLNTLGLFVEVPGKQTYYTKPDVTFFIEETTTVTVGIFVGNDVNFVLQDVKPVLVKGNTAGSFYAD